MKHHIEHNGQLKKVRPADMPLLAKLGMWSTSCGEVMGWYVTWREQEQDRRRALEACNGVLDE